MTFHLKDLDTLTLHHLAREARRHMTPDQINAAAKSARANMLLVNRQRELFRRQVLEYRGEAGDNWQQLANVTANVVQFRRSR
jgi:hypothetical protein